MLVEKKQDRKMAFYGVGKGLCIDWPQVENSLLFFNNL